MFEYISQPSLPQKMAAVAIVSSVDNDIVNELNKLGVKTILTGCVNSEVNNPESSHADMQILHTGENNLIILKSSTLDTSILSSLGFKITYTDKYIEKFKYPECAELNCVILDKFIIGNRKTISRKVFENCPNKTFINATQGYTKCSTAIVGTNAVITADSSIYNAAAKNKLDCLKISAGGIYLCEKYEGFIGGCCFKADKSTLMFTGDITKHQDYENIKAFCRQYNVYIESLSNKPLYDIGGIIPIMER